jgi:hypothetical protein
MANRAFLYSAGPDPIGGFMKADNNPAPVGAAAKKQGLFCGRTLPYFCSGPGSRHYTALSGLIGTVLHVLAWLLAAFSDFFYIAPKIDEDLSPGAYTYWAWGVSALSVGLAGIVLCGVLHMFRIGGIEFPEGAAPPWLMTLFIGGAQLSLLLTVLQMIATSQGIENDFFHYEGTLTVTEQKDARGELRNWLVISAAAKLYVMQFLQNNQAWAGPANDMTKIPSTETAA